MSEESKTESYSDYLTLFNKYSKLDEKYYRYEAVLKDVTTRHALTSKKIGIFKPDLPHDRVLELCSNDAIMFSVHMLGIVPRPHQLYMLEQMQTKKRLAMCLGRRLGKSKVNQIFILWATIFNKYPSELAGTTFSIICQDLDTGKDLYIEEMYMMLEEGDQVVAKNFNKRLGENWFTSKLLTMKDKSGKVTGTQISLRIRDKEGVEKVCKIRALPPTAKARGKEGNIIGDEVSFWKKNNSCPNDIDFYDTVIHPILTDNSNYISILSSTPDGYGDVWEKMFDPEGQHFTEYEKVWFPCWAFNKPEYTAMMKKEQEKYAKRGESWKFQQEYEARFVQMRDQFFDEEKHIQPFFNEKLFFTHTTGGGDSYLGLDFGGTMTSHTAITITETVGEHKGQIIFYKEYPVNVDQSLVQDIVTLVKQYPHIKKIVYDNKGGRYIEQRLREIFGEYFLHPFNFSTDKQKGFSLLKQAMSSGDLQCPHDKLVLNQLRNFTDKLKPQNKDISDDVLDSIMMSAFLIMDRKTSNFNVIRY